MTVACDPISGTEGLSAPHIRVIGVPAGACPDGLVPVAWFLWNNALLHRDVGTRPAAASCCASWQLWPCTSGMGDLRRPVGHRHVDRLPRLHRRGRRRATAPRWCPAAGCCRPAWAGCLTWFWPAHCWMVVDVLADQVGQREPGDHVHGDRLVLRPEVPAAGSVPATAPICGLLATPTGLVAAATVSPAARSTASACATVSPGGIGGTVIIRGPCETVSTIVAPGSARPDGDGADHLALGHVVVDHRRAGAHLEAGLPQRLRRRPPPSAWPPRARACTAPRSATSRRR